MSKKVKRILIVDNDQHISQRLLEVLNQGGYIAEAAHTSKEALRLAQQNHFNCMLSDVKMQDMTTDDLFSKLQKSCPSLSIILMTSSSYENYPRVRLAEGVVAVINKPLDEDILFLYLSVLR